MNNLQIAQIWSTMTEKQQLVVTNELVDILYERPVNNNPELVGFDRDQLEAAGLLFGIAKKAVYDNDNGRRKMETNPVK